jgi:hypothetical protein
MEVRQTLRSGFAVGTIKNLHSQWKSFILFCRYFALDPVPCSLKTVCLYATFLARSFISPQSVRNYVSSVSLYQEFHGADTQVFKNLKFKLLLRGISRNKKHLPRQVKPITPALLLKVYRHLQLETERDSAFWASLLVAFYLMLRKSNLIPKTQDAFDYKKHLSRCHLLCRSELILVKIVWSKTIQFGQRILTLPLVRIPGSELCPVLAINKLFSRVKTPKESSAFSFHEHGKLIIWTEDSWTSYLRYILGKIVDNPMDYSGHSLRRGGATYAFQAGAPSELVQLYGDWQSDAYKNYIHCNMVDKLILATTVRDKINAVSDRV